MQKRASYMRSRVVQIIIRAFDCIPHFITYLFVYKVEYSSVYYLMLPVFEQIPLYNILFYLKLDFNNEKSNLLHVGTCKKPATRPSFMYIIFSISYNLILI